MDEQVVGNPNEYYGVGQIEPQNVEDTSVVMENELKFKLFLVCLFGGWLGLHRFWVGKNVSAVVMTVVIIFTLGLAWIIWVPIDLTLIATGNFKDRNGNKIEF